MSASSRRAACWTSAGVGLASSYPAHAARSAFADARLPDRFRSAELLPLGSRIRRRLALDSTSCSRASSTGSPSPAIRA